MQGKDQVNISGEINACSGLFFFVERVHSTIRFIQENQLPSSGIVNFFIT